MAINFRYLDIIGFVVYTAIVLMMVVKSIFEYNSFYWNNPIILGTTSGAITVYWFKSIKSVKVAKGENDE